MAFFAELCFNSTVHYIDLVEKLYTAVRLLVYFIGQGIIFSLRFHAIEISPQGRGPFDWLTVSIYFLFVPVILVLSLLAIKHSCRSKSGHPLGDGISLEKFNQLKRSRDWFSWTAIVLLILILIFSQLYIKGIVDTIFWKDYVTLKLSCFIFMPAFGLLTILAFSCSNVFKIWLSSDLEDIIRERLLMERGRQARIAQNQRDEEEREKNKKPQVEYIEDSKASIEMFNMKNSIYFSAVDAQRKKTDLNEKKKKSRNQDKRVISVSLVNENEDFILNSVLLDPRNSKNKKKHRTISSKKIITKEEKDLLDFNKDCLICMEKKIDAIMSPCNHGGVCFECAKKNLNTKNACYYCREVNVDY